MWAVADATVLYLVKPYYYDSTLVLKNQFTLKDTFWYILGGLLKQGTDISPK